MLATLKIICDFAGLKPTEKIEKITNFGEIKMENERKTEKLLLRLTPTEKQNIAYHAKLMNVTMTEYISLCIRRKRIVICENFPDLIYQLSRIGNNINQIAAIANSNQYVSIKNVNEVKSLMDKCYEAMNDFISFIAEPENDYLKNDSSKISELLGELSNSLKSMNNRLIKIESKMDY